MKIGEFKKNNRFNTRIPESEIFIQSEKDDRVKSYLIPKKIIWKSESENVKIINDKALLEKRSGQITLDTVNPCILHNQGGEAGVLLDFGIELQGGIEILVWKCGANNKNAKLRIRFGESVMEAMSEIGGQGNATNNCAVRDMVVEVSCHGMTEIGNTGFRFVRIDLLDEDAYIEIKSVRAAFVYRDIEYKGSFRCNDDLLNAIWNTGAYTVHLNMQNYLWDGIKRDRLVWIGDMHPETSTIQAVFGYDYVVPKSLDFVREETKLPGWMNGIPTYSMWWILIHHSWYMHNGDILYLTEQKEYLLALLNQLVEYIDENGRSATPEWRFVDWPSTKNQQAVDAGIHAIMVLAMDAGAKLLSVLKDQKNSEKCSQAVEKLRQYKHDHNGNKQAAALMVLAGIADAAIINKEVLSVEGAKNLSAFMGFYVLKARALAGDIIGSLDSIREYWGGMLKLGATTFWEDFNIEWMENSARIDEIVTGNKKDVHGSYGDYCYKGYRHSLCHGWSSGPTPWLTENILGIKILAPGCKVIRIAPNLGDLQWVEGTYPTPLGIIYIRHERQDDGHIKSSIDVPEGIEVLR